MGVFDHSDGMREIHVSTQAILDEPNVHRIRCKCTAVAIAGCSAPLLARLRFAYGLLSLDAGERWCGCWYIVLCCTALCIVLCRIDIGLCLLQCCTFV